MDNYTNRKAHSRQTKKKGRVGVRKHKMKVNLTHPTDALDPIFGNIIEGGITNLKSPNAKYLTDINMSNQSLTDFPYELTTLYHPQYIKLSSNEIETLPPEIGRLQGLKSLSLSYNRISSLPPEIGNLKSLTKLYISNNRISSLPPEIGNLKSLEYLNLHNNRITALPTELLTLPNLQAISIDKSLVADPTIKKLKNREVEIVVING